MTQKNSQASATAARDPSLVFTDSITAYSTNSGIPLGRADIGTDSTLTIPTPITFPRACFYSTSKTLLGALALATVVVAFISSAEVTRNTIANDFGETFPLGNEWWENLDTSTRDAIANTGFWLGGGLNALIILALISNFIKGIQLFLRSFNTHKGYFALYALFAFSCLIAALLAGFANAVSWIDESYVRAVLSFIIGVLLTAPINLSSSFESMNGADFHSSAANQVMTMLNKLQYFFSSKELPEQEKLLKNQFPEFTASDSGPAKALIQARDKLIKLEQVRGLYEIGIKNHLHQTSRLRRFVEWISYGLQWHTVPVGAPFAILGVGISLMKIMELVSSNRFLNMTVSGILAFFSCPSTMLTFRDAYRNTMENVIYLDYILLKHYHSSRVDKAVHLVMIPLIYVSAVFASMNDTNANAPIVKLLLSWIHKWFNVAISDYSADVVVTVWNCLFLPLQSFLLGSVAHQIFSDYLFKGNNLIAQNLVKARSYDDNNNSCQQRFFGPAVRDVAQNAVSVGISNLSEQSFEEPCLGSQERAAASALAKATVPVHSENGALLPR